MYGNLFFNTASTCGYSCCKTKFSQLRLRDNSDSTQMSTKFCNTDWLLCSPNGQRFSIFKSSWSGTLLNISQFLHNGLVSCNFLWPSWQNYSFHMTRYRHLQLRGYEHFDLISKEIRLSLRQLGIRKLPVRPFCNESHCSCADFLYQAKTCHVSWRHIKICNIEYTKEHSAFVSVWVWAGIS
jgi:hypothetical protein